MDFMSILRLAMRALARNKMRSILTMLGVIIGVGAVIASVAVGEGASEQIQEQISNLGDNMIWVEAGGRAVNGVRTGSRGTKTLVMGDVKAIQQQVPLVYNCSVTWTDRYRSSMGIRTGLARRGVWLRNFFWCGAWVSREEVFFRRTTWIIRRTSACWDKPLWTICLAPPIR